jgi:hypothetical protein
MIDMPEGWVPNDSASVDPQLETDLKDVQGTSTNTGRTDAQHSRETQGVL